MENTIDLNNPAVRDRVEYLGQQAERSIMADFVTRHPELLNAPLDADIRNKQVIDAVMTENNLALTPENLEWSYRVALENGMLTLPMYHPAEEQAFEQMSTKQIASYLKARYQAPRPPNAWEFFPETGERTPRNGSSAKSDEESLPPKEKLLGGGRGAHYLIKSDPESTQMPPQQRNP